MMMVPNGLFVREKAEEAEKALVDAGESVLRDAVDGIPTTHLFACAEAYHGETLRLCL